MHKRHIFGKPLLGCWAFYLTFSLSGCSGGNGDDPPPPVQTDPPVTELSWDQGNWDELDWQ